ncbi:MAG TPA: hypothetical protein VN370_05395 [Desulfitobacteriaceae bacterium]|nr:hypothetical protein [Desulfitobacteriaceae bacterium]
MENSYFKMLEICRSCGFEHEDLTRVLFRRNHVSNRVLPYCGRCMRRLYRVDYRSARSMPENI